MTASSAARTSTGIYHASHPNRQVIKPVQSKVPKPSDRRRSPPTRSNRNAAATQLVEAARVIRGDSRVGWEVGIGFGGILGLSGFEIWNLRL